MAKSISDKKSEQQRIDMLDHAAARFAASEFHRTRTRELTTADGRFSEGAYFSKFKTKDGLLREIFHHFWYTTYQRIIEQTKEVADPVERFRCLIRASIQVYCEHEHIFRVTVANCYPSKKGDDSCSAEYRKKFGKFVLSEIARARQEGCLRDPEIPTEFILHSLIGTMERLLNECYQERFKRTRKTPRHCINIENMEVHMNYWLRGFFVDNKSPKSKNKKLKSKDSSALDRDLESESVEKLKVSHLSGGRSISVAPLELLALLKRGCFVRAVDDSSD